MSKNRKTLQERLDEADSIDAEEVNQALVEFSREMDSAKIKISKQQSLGEKLSSRTRLR